MSTNEELNQKLIGLIKSRLDEVVKEKILEGLKGQGVDIDRQNEDMQKVSYEELKKQGIDIEELAQNMQKVISEELGKHGVDINLSDEEVKEKIKKDLTEQGLDIKQPTYAIQKVVFEDLLKQGVNINQQDTLWETPLMKSIDEGNDTITNLLLDNEAKVNIYMGGVYTPLQRAVMKGNIDITKRLLEKKDKVNVGANIGYSPLYDAIESGNIQLVELLINNGASYKQYLPMLEASMELKPENKGIYDLIMKKEQEKEKQRLEKREEYIEKIKQETRDTQTLESSYSSQSIEMYVDLKMGRIADIKELDYKELDGLLQLYSKDKKNIVEPSQQKEISEDDLKAELAKDTYVYIRGIDNIAGLKDKDKVLTRNEYGGETEARKLARKAGKPTLTKINGVKTGNYNRCVAMVNSGKIMPFRSVGYGIIKETTDDIHIAARYDMHTVVNKQNDTIVRDDEGAYGEQYDSEMRRNLPIKEELDNIFDYWKNIDVETLKETQWDLNRQYNEVFMNVSDREVKFIYWTKDAKYAAGSTLAFNKLESIYFQRKYYKQTGRTLPIYEYKRNETNFLAETKFTDKDIVNMLREEILDESGKALKPEYSQGRAVDFLMTFNEQINQIENSKEIVKHFIADRLNEYSDKNNIDNVWNVINVIKYAGMNAQIIMEDETAKENFKNMLNVVFSNVLDTHTIVGFLDKRENGARFSVGKKENGTKDIMAVVGLLSEIREVAKDKTMEFLRPELEKILETKMIEITKGIETNILEPLGVKNREQKDEVLPEKVEIVRDNQEKQNKDNSQDININNADEEGKTALMLAVADGNIEMAKSLIGKGADIHKEDNTGKTVLMYAAEKGNVEMVEFLIKNGVKTDEKNKYGETALMHAKNIDVANLLINNQADIHMEDESGKTALMHVEDIEVAKLLIDKGANINKVGEKGYTPLGIAFERNNFELAKLLIERGASVNEAEKATIWKHTTLLIISCEKGEVELAKLLLEKGADINKADGFFEYTPLMIACKKENIELVKLLIEKGTDINKADKEGKTALMYAAEKGNVEMTELILEKGADINKIDKMGNTPLMIACEKGNAELVKLILDNKADVNRANKHGITALMISCKKALTSIVKLLLGRGAMVDKQNKEGKTALIMACENKNKEIAKVLIQNAAKTKELREIENPDTKKFVQELLKEISLDKTSLEKGADINTTDEYGKTELMYVAEEGDIEKAKLLLEKGVDINKADEGGRTALMCAAVVGNVEMTELLIDRGANINKVTEKGSTALMYAAVVGNVEVAKLLIDKGANINKGDKGGETALMYAVAKGNVKVAKLLIDRGADINKVTKKGSTALVYAAVVGNIEMTKLLIDRGADINKANEYGKTALMIACENKNKEIAKELIKSGAKTEQLEKIEDPDIKRFVGNLLRGINLDKTLDNMLLEIDNMLPEIKGRYEKNAPKPEIKEAKESIGNGVVQDNASKREEKTNLDANTKGNISDWQNGTVQRNASKKELQAVLTSDSNIAGGNVKKRVAKWEKGKQNYTNKGFGKLKSLQIDEKGYISLTPPNSISNFKIYNVTEHTNPNREEVKKAFQKGH